MVEDLAQPFSKVVLAQPFSKVDFFSLDNI